MRHCQLGPVTLRILDKEHVDAFLTDALRRRAPHRIVTFNALMYRSACTDDAFARAVSSADIAIADSMGICWALRLLTGGRVDRMAGIDVLQRLCAIAEFERKRIFLLGAAPGVAEAAATELQRRYPNLIIAGTSHGYFTGSDEPLILKKIRDSGTDILYVALSMSRQETWLAARFAETQATLGMGVGGSFDVIAGRLRRAPAWMQRSGLEWLFRLLQQPSRMARMLQLPVFVWDIIMLRLTSGAAGRARRKKR